MLLGSIIYADTMNYERLMKTLMPGMVESDRPHHGRPQNLFPGVGTFN